MKKIIPLLLFLLFLCSLGIIQAQNQAHNQVQRQAHTVSGTIVEKTSGEPIESASIRILKANDSTYVTGTVTNSKGYFAINVAPASYLVEVSFMGFTPQFKRASISSGDASIGKVTLIEDGVLLGEAVITAKAIDMQVKGDTIEYNADSYKVQQSAVVEDLLKKMPGVEIDSEGKITVNGKEVKKMLVDGKEFFSDDPKVASKSLPASMIDKLQVLDRRSNMSQMTGFDDGDEETVINLTIKPGMKEGFFGNAFAGYGSKERYEASAMANYMRNNTQMTFIGGLNNTNNAGFSDFASASFSGNRPSRGMSFGGNNGVAKTLNGGFNFATEHANGLKWGGDIRYGSVDNDVSSVSRTKYTKQGGREDNSQSLGRNQSGNFGANLKFEWAVDSATTIIFRPTLSYNENTNNQYSTTQSTAFSSRFSNMDTETKYTSDGSGVKLSGDLDISRKLGNKGRTISLTLSGGVNDSDDDGFNYTENKYKDLVTLLDSTVIRDQQFFQKDKSHNMRAFVSYVEPLGRNNFLQLTYNISKRSSITDKNTYLRNGVSGDYDILDADYTRKVENDFVNQNVSLNFKAVREKYDYTVGVGLEPSSSKTSIFEPGISEVSTPRRNFLSFAPNGRFNYKWDRRQNLRIEYRGSTNQPSTLQLYDGIIRRDGVDITMGNKDLKPSFENRVSLRYQKFSAEKGSSVMLFGRFNFRSNDIVTVTEWVNGGREMTYDNINGNMNGNLRFIANTPLRNRNFTISSMSNVSYRKDNSFVTEQNAPRIKNTANTYSATESAGISFRSEVKKGGAEHWLLKNVDLNLRGNITYQKVQYSTTKDQDRNIFNYGGSGDFSIFFQKNFTLQTDITFSTNSGYSTGFEQREWLWNASVSKDIFSSGTLRFKIYDILKQRSNISNQTTLDYVRDVTTNTINSYFMVNFIYRFQIFKGGAKIVDMEDSMPRGGGYRGGGGGDRHGR